MPFPPLLPSCPSCPSRPCLPSCPSCPACPVLPLLGPDVAVVSYRLWQQRLGGRADVLGRTITLDRRKYTVIGVMPQYLDLWGGQVWLPIQLDMADPIARTSASGSRWS